MKTNNTQLKKAFITLALIIAGTTISLAQCGKTATFKSSVTNYVNDKGEIERSKDEETIVTVNEKEVTIMPGEHTMTGVVKDYTCSWTVPYKEGKTSFSAVLDNQGQEMHTHITIEGKAGKVVLTFTADEMPGKKIQVVADKFE